MNTNSISDISYENLDKKVEALKECVYKNIKKPFMGDEDELIEVTFKELTKCFKLQNDAETRDYFEAVLSEVYESDDFIDIYNRFDESRDCGDSLYIQNGFLKEAIAVLIEGIMLEASYSV